MKCAVRHKMRVVKPNESIPTVPGNIFKIRQNSARGSNK